MKALDIANIFIQRYAECQITNLKLNKLVYLAQEEALFWDGPPLFDDEIEAWQFGPVVPSVYHAFKSYGRAPIACPSSCVPKDARAERIVDTTAEKYAKLTAFDLVNITHAEGGAWSKAYFPGVDNVITLESIATSKRSRPTPRTLAGGINAVEEK